MDKDEEAAWQKQHLLQQLTPRLLLLNMAVDRERSPGYEYYRIGIAARMLEGDGANLAAFDAEAREIEARLTADPEVAARLDAVRAMGFRACFSIYDEPWRRDLNLNIIQNPEADRLLRAEAKAASGIRTPEESRRYDEQWHLYLKQNYAKDWEAWRAREPKAEWP